MKEETGEDNMMTLVGIEVGGVVAGSEREVVGKELGREVGGPVGGAGGPFV